MAGTFPCVDGGISARPTVRQEPPAPLNGPRAAPPPFSPSSATNQDRRCVFPPDKSPRILLRQAPVLPPPGLPSDRKSTRLNSSHVSISYAVFCLKKKTKKQKKTEQAGRRSTP